MEIKTFNLYQEKAARTRNFNDTELTNYTMGLVCESGEFGDMMKKHLFHGHKLDTELASKELGDVLWYLSNLCDVLGLKLEDIALQNIEKLEKRYPSGFSKSDSINRVE